ncbi:MAG: hypothetical protein PHP92_05205 [Candidatus Nanoarchaeia archaeon]|nr:hypothetical protein [Candidatus Nanoarchaeia archaeon]
MIESNDIEKVVQFNNDINTFKLESELNDKDLEIVNHELVSIKNDEEHEMNDCMDYEIVNYVFEKLGIKNEAFDISEIEVVYDDEEVIIAYTGNGNIELDTLDNYDYSYSYQYWDGHNWVRTYIEEIDDDTIDFDDEDVDFISLDEWDGSNWNFKSQASHASVSKLADKWLLKEWSQYQGTETTVTVIETEEELKEWFEENETALPEGIL